MDPWEELLRWEPTPCKFWVHCLTAPVQVDHDCSMYGFHMQFAFADNSSPWHFVDTCWHFIFDLLHLSLGQQLYVMSPAQLTHWTNARLTNLDFQVQEAQSIPNRRSISLGNPCLSEMHGSIAFSESSEYYAPLQFWSRRSICRLYFCAKSHKLGINPWQQTQHSWPAVFAPLHCTRW